MVNNEKMAAKKPLESMIRLNYHSIKRYGPVWGTHMSLNQGEVIILQ